MKPLYEYTAEYQKIISLIEDCDELSPDHKEMLEHVSQDANLKVINVAAFIKNLEEKSQGMDDYIKNMKERKQKVDNKITSLKDYLLYNMRALHIDKVEAPEFDVKVRTNQYALELTDASLLPTEYIKEKIDRSIDKLKIIADLKNDLLIPGAQFIKTSTIQIK
jgi:Siphovirus Gp157